MSYRVRLENFEGPLDLLLFLIRKNEVDIYDIPIAEITRQYLDYLEIIKVFDLEYAGDFLIMAATLIRIKSQMLLPRPKSDEDEEELIDPRLELVTRILEYKRFKEVAHKLHDIGERQSNVFPRVYFPGQHDGEDEEWVPRENVSLFTLISVFKDVIENIPKETFHEITDIKITTDEQIEYILGELKNSERISFYDLLAGFENRLKIIVTFIALLELIKQNRITVKQSLPFGEIWIRKN
ncbi:segregation/condensation protein A [candidate division KSB1 bacterium]|nr:segregation/condensation protein A [candidate division KSB1 bacterium]